MKQALNALEAQGILAQNKRERYNTVERLGLLKGPIDLKREVSASSSPTAPTDPTSSSPGNVADAMDNDRVLGLRITSRSEDGRIEGAVVRIRRTRPQVRRRRLFQGAVFPKNPIGEYLHRRRRRSVRI
ncbi:MAG: hypothetical protein MZU97_06660 [Bacillus subtilis]|nr:hypothetical protein [Bacillus subtilis]